MELKSIDDELGQSLHKLEKKLKQQRIENKKRKVAELVPDKEFSEIIEKIILPIMIEYKKFLEKFEIDYDERYVFKALE